MAGGAHVPPQGGSAGPGGRGGHDGPASSLGPVGPLDLAALARARRRAGRMAPGGGPRLAGLLDETRRRLLERLQDLTVSFSCPLDFASIPRPLVPPPAEAGALGASAAARAGGPVPASILAARLLEASTAPPEAPSEGPEPKGPEGAEGAEGAEGGAPPPPDLFPLPEGAADLVVSHMALHAANDLPGALLRARRALKPGGLFLASLAGPETLLSLRRTLLEAEAEVRGGAALRVWPFPDLRDAGRLLSAAGFALPVLERDVLHAHWPRLGDLMRELRAAGAVNIVAGPRPPLTRAVLARAEALWAEHGGSETFEAIYLTAWAPDEAQQKPLAPGAASASLAEALGAGLSDERSTLAPDAPRASGRPSEPSEPPAPEPSADSPQQKPPRAR